MSEEKKDTSLEEVDEKTIEERMDEIGQELMATGFKYIYRVRRGGKVSAEEEAAQQEIRSQFRLIEDTYLKLKKMGRISGGKKNNNDDAFNKSVMEKIKEERGSLGDIAANIPKD